MSSVDSAVNFTGTVDGNRNLTVNSGTANTTFTGAVGATSALGSGTGAALTLQGSGSTTFQDTVATRSGVVAAGPVVFNKNASFANGDTGSTFTGRVTSGGSSGNTVSGFDGLAFNGGLTLSGGPVSVASNGSTLHFGDTVGGAQALTLNALAGGAGTITGLAQIGTGSNLSSLSLTGHTLSLPATGLAVAGPMDFTAAGGITLNGPVGQAATPATGTLSFNSPVLLATGAVTVSTNNAAVNFASTVDGAQALTVNAGSGQTTFGGAVGGNTALSSLDTDAGGTTRLNGGGVTTTGAQTYRDAVTLGAATTLTGNTLSLDGTVNGAQALTLADAGTTTLGGVVGGSTALSSLSTQAGGSTRINSSAITTSGAQTFNDAVVLGANTTLTSGGSTFNSTVDGAASGAQALTANAGSNALRFNGAVGGSTPLNSLTATGNTVGAVAANTTGGQSYTAISGVTLGGALGTTGGGVSVTGPTTLSADVAVATQGGDIRFVGGTSSINGAQALTLTAGNGDVVLGGSVGGLTPLTAVTISGRDITLPGIVTAGDANQSYTALNNITLNQSRTLNAPIAFTADADGDGSGSFILPNGVSLTASNNTLSITAADLDLQGSSTLASGSGLMSITASNGRNLALGGSDAAGQMTISGSELSRITSSGGLDLKTSGAGWIRVNGITATQSQNLTGTLGLKAQGTGDIGFITAASSFNAVTTNATGGNTTLGVNLSTSNDAISFVTPVVVDGAATVNSGGAAIGFGSTLTLDQPLSLSTGNGNLSLGGAVGGASTLTVNLGGGSVTGLAQIGSTLTGLSLSGTAAVTLPALSINGPMSFNTGAVTATGDLQATGISFGNTVTVQPASGSSLALNAGTGTLALASTLSAGANSLTLTGDEIDFGAAVTGTGALVLQPGSDGRDIAVGGSSAITGLNLSATEVARLPGTLASLTVGRSTGTGTLDLAGTLALGSTPLTLNAGSLQQSGGTLGAGALTLRANTGGIDLQRNGNSFGAVAINGSPTALALRNTQGITQQGSAAWALGSAPVSLNAGTQDITLTNSGNTFGTLSLSGRQAQVVEAAAAELGASTLSSHLVLSSTGAITQSGALAVAGNLTLSTTVNAGDVSIDNSGASATRIGDTQVGGNYTLVATGSPVAQAAGTSYQVVGDLSITGASIVLGGAGNLVGGSTSLPASNTTVVRQAGVITLGDRTDSGDLTVISERTNRSFSGSALNGNAIVLNNAANHIGGSISVTASPGTISTSGADVQTGIVQGAGTTLSVAGVASFTAEASAAGSLGIVLDNAGNQLGTLKLSGTTVSVSNAATGTTTLDGASASTSLVITTAGALAQTGAISTPALTVRSNGAATLTHASNDVNTLDAQTAGGALQYTDANGLAVAGLDVGGANASLTAGGSGHLTQTAALQNVGALTLSAGGAVTLDNAGNQIGSLAGANAGSGISLRNGAGLVLSGGVRSTTGDVLLRSNGDLTLNGSASVRADAGGLVLSTEAAGNFINNVDANVFSVGSGQRWLVYSNTPDLNSGARTVKGGLTSNFRHYAGTYASYAPGSVTQSGNGFIYRDSASTLTVRAAVNGSASHVYGDTPTGTLGYVISAGLLDSEDSAGNIITGGSAAFDTTLANTMNAGSYTVRYNGGLSSSYTLVADTDGAAYTVTPAVLTYTANAATRSYGAADPAFSGGLTGFKLGQNASVLSGSLVWSTPATATSGVGSHAVQGGGYSAGNYSFVQAAGNATALSITPAALSVSLNNASKTYDGTAYSGGNGLSYSGFVNGEDASVLGGSLVYGGSAQGARNAGNYTLSASGLTAANYTLSYSSGTLAVARANLVVSSSDVSKVYNGTLAANGTAVASAGTQLFGDTLSGGSFAFTDANASSGKTVTVSGVTVNDGNGGNNYNLSYAANTSSSITPATLTVSSANTSKVYDGNTSASATAVVVGGTLYANASNGGSTDSLSGGSFAYTDANAGSGNKTVQTSGVLVNDGNGGSNYSLVYVDNTSSSITPKALTLSATVASKVYDGSTSATVAGTTLSGLVNGQSLGVNVGAAVFADANAANGKAVALSGLALQDGAGGLAANYSLASTASSSGSITPKALTVAVSVADRVYDGSTTATLNGLALSGLVGSETLTAVSTGSASFADKNAGIGKTVTVTGLNLVNGSGLASNYSVPTSAQGTATITPATLTVAGVVAIDRVYDGTLDAPLNTDAAVLAGRLGSDQVQVSSITGTFADKNVGNNKTILPSGSFTLSGADAGNYTVQQPTGLSASVTPRSLLVTATGNDKVYDGGTSASVVLGDNRVIGDVLNASASASFLDKNAGVGKFISVTGITLAGTDAGNYVANSSTAAFASIGRATLNVSATGVDRVYDATTRATVTLADNRLGNDVLSVAYGSAQFADKNVGSGKAISVSGLSLSGADANNYVLGNGGSTTASASISPASITAISGLQVASKVYDGTTTATLAGGQAVLTGALAGDAVSVAATSARFADKNAGTGKTVVVDGLVLIGSDAGNYVLQASAGAGTGTITAAPLAVVVTAADKVYDASTTATVSFTDNRVNGDQLSLGVTSANFADKNVGSNKAITLSGLSLGGVDAGNYTLSSVAQAVASITQATLSLGSVGVADKVYDGTRSATLAGTAPVLGGLYSGDGVSLNVGSLLFADKNAGTGKTVTLAGFSLSGADAGNYRLAQSSLSAVASISPALLSVSASASAKVYDGSTSAAVSLADNRVSGDQLSLSVGSANFADKNAGNGKTVTVQGLALAGSDAGNYTLAGSSVNTRADITPAPLSITATGVDRVYDASTTATVNLADNRIGGDQLSLSVGSARFADKNVGSSKAISVSGIVVGGADAGNYVANTSTTASASVSPATLTVRAEAAGKVADGTDSVSVTLRDNRLAGDDIALSLETARFLDITAGSNKPVLVSGLRISGGADRGNYVLAGNEVRTRADISGYLDTWSQPPLAPVPTVVPVTVSPPPPVLATEMGLPPAAAPSGGVPGAAVVVPASATVSVGAAAVQVDVVQAAAPNQPGVVAVSVPRAVVQSGGGFVFPLPGELAQAGANTTPSVSLVNGQALPSWLRYDAGSQSFVASAPPAGALPLEVLVRIGERRWTLRITEKAS